MLTTLSKPSIIVKTNKGQPYSCHLPDTNQGDDETIESPSIDTNISEHLNYLQDKCLVKVSHGICMHVTTNAFRIKDGGHTNIVIVVK